MQTERIANVGPDLRSELTLLGPTFDCVWPVELAPNFSELLRAIDEADREPRGKTDTCH